MSGARPRSFWVLVALLVVTHFLLHLGLGIGVAAPDLLTVAVLLSARRMRGWSAAALGRGCALPLRGRCERGRARVAGLRRRALARPVHR